MNGGVLIYFRVSVRFVGTGYGCSMFMFSSLEYLQEKMNAYAANNQVSDWQEGK